MSKQPFPRLCCRRVAASSSCFRPGPVSRYLHSLSRMCARRSESFRVSVSRRLFQTANGRADLERKLLAFRPHVLLYIGCAEERDGDGSPRLALFHGQTVTLQELGRLFASTGCTPDLLHLGLLAGGEPRRELSLLDTSCLGVRVAALIVDRCSPPDAAAQMTCGFLDRLLGGGVDPVTAACGARRDGVPAGSMLCQLFADYDKWSTDIVADYGRVAPRGAMESTGSGSAGRFDSVWASCSKRASGGAHRVRRARQLAERLLRAGAQRPQSR